MTLLGLLALAAFIFFPERRTPVQRAEVPALGTPEGGANSDQTWPAWQGLGRLLEFQFSPSGITPAGTAPIPLEANLGDIHNWEGLARLDDRGFLLVSDEIPDSTLGFVPFPDDVE